MAQKGLRHILFSLWPWLRWYSTLPSYSTLYNIHAYIRLLVGNKIRLEVRLGGIKLYLHQTHHYETHRSQMMLVHISWQLADIDL
jgi:hypothetical protein